MLDYITPTKVNQSKLQTVIFIHPKIAFGDKLRERRDGLTAILKSAVIRKLIEVKKNRKPNMKDILKKAINHLRTQHRGK